MLRPIRSTIIISVFLVFNLGVLVTALSHLGKENWGQDSNEMMSKTPSEMEVLEYFHLDEGKPSLSLAADFMTSLGEEEAHFTNPRGLYAVGTDRKSLFYQGAEADYSKSKQRLRLSGNVKLDYKSTTYEGQKLTYYPGKDLVDGSGGVEVNHQVAKSGDRVKITATKMRARPKQEWAEFKGQVIGHTTPRLKFQPPIDFRAQEMEMLGANSEIRLRQDVFFQRGQMQVTSQKGEIFLENKNKKLKYFVLNDDVKVTEKLVDSTGKPLTRKAWAERLEGFGADRLVLSGAPRVEQEKDVVKGYRITLREKMEFLEVEDAMSDLSTKKKQKDKEQ